jgi:predicted Zn-dependent protease
MINRMKPRSLVTALVAWMCAVSIGFAPPMAAAQNLPSLGDTERQELSPLMEHKLGEQIMNDIRRDRDYLNDAPLLEYLNNFGSILLAAHPEARGETSYDFFFFAVRDPTLNAFALPGGFIAVHSGLVLAAQNESELASVVAHEIGHVSQRHIARMLGQQRQDSLIPLAWCWRRWQRVPIPTLRRRCCWEGRVSPPSASSISAVTPNVKPTASVWRCCATPVSILRG